MYRLILSSGLSVSCLAGLLGRYLSGLQHAEKMQVIDQSIPCVSSCLASVVPTQATLHGHEVGADAG